MLLIDHCNANTITPACVVDHAMRITLFNFIARGFKDRLFREIFLINSSTGCSVDGIFISLCDE